MARTTFSGPVASTNGFIAPTYTVTTANAIAAADRTIGQVIYVSNGLAGAPTLAVYNGTNWISAAGTAISAT
jgi:ABC-type phosphate/phosphonate transport system substrate-binding protein